MSGSHRNLAATAGRWSAQRPRRTIIGWLVFVLAVFAAGTMVGTQRLEGIDVGNGESHRADLAVREAFTQKADENVLIQSRGDLRIRDRRFRAAIRDVRGRLLRVPYAFDVRSPLGPGNGGQVSRDGRSALVLFSLRGGEDVWEARVARALGATAAVQRAHPELRVEQFGDASMARALNKSFGDDFRKAEVTSLPVTLLILLVAFGSLVAAGVPLLLGLTAVMAGLGLLAVVSHVIPVDDSASSVVLLIGLAVGVDYSMFYLRRKLEERDAGRSSRDALLVAAATSGRAVLISGLTVMIAMAGMLFAGNPVFTSFSVGTMLVVAVAILGSVTVLPAVLAALGDRVERGRVAFGARRHRRRGDSRAWGWILDRVLRRPALSLALGAGLLLALALPAAGMHTVTPGASAMPRNLAIMKTYDRLQRAFPGGPDPAVVVVQAADVTAPAVRRGIRRFTAAALPAVGMRGPALTTVSPDRTLAVVSVPLPGDGTETRSEAALMTLRRTVVPATLGRVPGVRAQISGMTAQSKDFNDTMKAHLPYVFGFVLGLAFVLLLVTFRSIVVPLVAIALNLLSVSAAYGALKLIFQDGHGEGVLGFKSIGGIVSWLPLFLFVILFGLSMDYHVFILSRIREGHDAGRSTGDAVTEAIKSTAGVVTSAAVVMVAVFSIFATLSSVIFKQVGVALGVAVLLDATIVRAVLLPSVMKLLGERNWYLPRRLGRLLGGGRPPAPPRVEPVARAGERPRVSA